LGDEQKKASIIYNSEFDFQEIDEYTAMFAKCKSPSKTKGGLVMDVITSIPNTNKNGMGFTAKVLENSYESMLQCPLDYQHDQPIILGHVIDSKVVPIEESMAKLRTAAITYKKRLAAWNIENLANMQYSMECIPSGYAFYTPTKGVVEKENAPVEWIEHLADWDDGTPVYDSETNERVILLLGGSEGSVEFIGIGITDRPADTTAYTLLQVAHEKSIHSEGGNELENYTQEQLDQKLNELKEQLASEYATKIEEAKTVTATAKDAEWQTKFDEVQASLTSEKERANNAEAALGEIKAKELVASRKEILAEANYPENMLEKKAEFIASATDEVFEAFVAEFKELTASFKHAKEVVATEKQIQKTVVASITDTDDNKDVEKVDLSFFV
jgi:hypothetical protein